MGAIERVNESFARRLARLVAASGLPARRVAAAAAISPAYLSDLVHGHRASVSPEVARRLAVALGVTTGELAAPVRVIAPYSSRPAAMDRAVINEVMDALDAAWSFLDRCDSDAGARQVKDRLHAARRLLERASEGIEDGAESGGVSSRR